MKIAGLVAADVLMVDVGTSAGETVIAGVDTLQYMSAMVLVEADMMLVIVELVEAIVSTGGEWFLQSWCYLFAHVLGHMCLPALQIIMGPLEETDHGGREL